VLEGSVARDSGAEGGLSFVAFNVPLGLDQTYKRYLELLDRAPYELLNSENEGFEAELYGRDPESGDAVAVQMRHPGCDEAVSVVVTFGRVGDPTGKGSGTSN
jgi:hypothetical protein